ncbi:MAG: CDF family Co(II)/Ni(II) efflux transporter DmeF [Desulfobacteraceae bacterium]|nr:CDF family Co(II)/Ni(II) efflux transporter DmeF [Desulfobacteraceae bacterium]MBC2754701.1 CDF family Co(II)/Ni(II) efflux transporter DmeF [Desulfobacteraceae bacterium]
MHIHTLGNWRHSHNFTLIHEKGELRTKQVLVLTVITMVAEIVAGTVFGSMALLADGWHMGTHAAAFTITIFAYRYSQKHSADRRFTFGTGKVSVLGGFASAVVLGVVALLMAIESIHRLLDPQIIHFNEAIAVAVLGLTVNLICAVLLHGHHSHGHNNYDHSHDHGHQHTDHNIRGAYFHVIADALTSVLAIVALFFGKYFGWNWLDPVIGIVGALVITRWALGLLNDTSSILLDNNIDLKRKQEIKSVIESDSDNRVSDIHVWKVGPVDYAAMISIVTHFPKNPEYYKKLLHDFRELSHMTVEVNVCNDVPCIAPNGKIS